MEVPHVYDKAKYHDETIEQHGLPEEHASNHTVVILRWLIENDLMGGDFTEEPEPLEKYLAGNMSIHDLYNWWDRCLIDDMLSDRGNEFAKHYFDFQKGEFIHDYMRILQGTLPSEFHIAYSEENYQTIKAIIDTKYKKWATPKKKWWRL